VLRSKLLRVGSAGVLSLASLVGPACAWDDGAKPERLLPLVERVPEGLDVEALDVFGPNWTPWTEETAKLLEELYEGTPDDAAQLAALQKLQLKRATLDAALRDPVYAPIYGSLYDLRGKLERRLDVYAALRNVLQATPDAVAPSPFPAFQSALNEVETSLLVIPNGSNWLPYYGSEGLNKILERGSFAAEDAMLLEQSLARINGGEPLTPEQQEFLKQPMFRKLASALAAGIASIQPDAAAQPQNPLYAPAEKFLTALEEYETSGSRQASGEMQQELSAIQSMAGAAAGPLVAAVDKHYRNYNLQLSVGETFMQTFFSDQRSESGGVSEYVKEVYVSGCQWTNTVIGVDLKPCNTAAKFTLTIDGNNRSQTTGEVCSATVYNTGTARFRAEKDVLFDGHCFTLCPARVGVNASNCTYDAETCLSWVPIAGKLARSYALDQAAERKPESDAYARQKISREVRTRFDRETAEQFKKAEQDIQAKLYGPLAEVDMEPEQIAFMSSEIHLGVHERLMRDAELAAGRAPAYPTPMNGLLVQIHQSLLSNGADRMDFHGERLTQKEVNAKIKSRLDKLMPDRDEPAADAAVIVEPNPEESEVERQQRLERESKNDNTRLIFDTVDPISFRFEDGEIIMSLRAGLERPGEEPIPTQIISVPLALTIEGDQLVMTRGAVGVKPAERPNNVGEQITRAQIMRSKIEEGIPERQTRDAKKEIVQQGKRVVVQVRSVAADDGWMTLTIE
jgi:hypothetical protein